MGVLIALGWMATFAAMIFAAYSVTRGPLQRWLAAREHRQLAGVQLGDLWECEQGVFIVEDAIQDVTSVGRGHIVRGHLGTTDIMWEHERAAGEWWLVMRDGCPTSQRLRECQRRGEVS